MFKSMSIKLALIGMVAVVLSGCASTQRMSDEDRAKVKAAHISSSVEKGQAFVLPPGGASVGLMFGAVGGLASSGAIQDAQTAFTVYLQKNNISIERIVQEEFESALKASGKLEVMASANPSIPTIKVAVPQYGFGVVHLLSSNVVPVLQLSSEMVDGTGKVIWRASDRMLPSIASPMDSVAWADIANSPAEIEKRLRAAAAFLSKKLVSEL